MNIIHLSPHCDPEADLGEQDAGGQCVYEHQLSHTLSQYGNHDVTVYCRDTNKRAAFSRINRNYRIVRIPCGKPGFIAKEDLEPVLGEFARRVAKDSFFTTHAIVHAHYWDGGKAALLLKSLLSEDMPLVWTPHSLGMVKRSRFPELNNEILYNFIPRITWENYTMHIADKIVWSTSQDAPVMTEYYGVEPDKIEVIEPGIDFERLHRIDKQKARLQYNLPQEGVMLLTVGRLTPSKCYEYAIDALAEDKSKRQVYLVVCGGNYLHPSSEEQEYVYELKRRAFERGVSERVIFIPAVSYDAIHTIYSAADILIHTSPKEPHGLTVLEAMSMGIPSLVSKGCGIASRLVHAQNSMIVDMHHAPEVSSVIHELTTDPKLYQTISTTAYTETRSVYSWHSRIKEYERMYHRVWLHKNRVSFHRMVRSNYFLEQNMIQSGDVFGIKRYQQTAL